VQCATALKEKEQAANKPSESDLDGEALGGEEDQKEEKKEDQKEEKTEKQTEEGADGANSDDEKPEEKEKDEDVVGAKYVEPGQPTEEPVAKPQAAADIPWTEELQAEVAFFCGKMILDNIQVQPIEDTETFKAEKAKSEIESLRKYHLRNVFVTFHLQECFGCSHWFVRNFTLRRQCTHSSTVRGRQQQPRSWTRSARPLRVIRGQLSN